MELKVVFLFEIYKIDQSYILLKVWHILLECLKWVIFLLIRMSEKKKGFLPFRNSSSVMHFYHNGTFNPHTIDESSPPKIKSYAASTERSTSCKPTNI